VSQNGINVANRTIDVTQSFTTTPAFPANSSFRINVPASRSTFPNCVPVQASLTPPKVFTNIFWDNRAGSYDNGFVRGIGLPGDPDAINHWDLGAYGIANDGIKPVNNDIQDLANHPGYAGHGNVSVDPKVQSAYDTTIRLATFRGDPHFVGGVIVAVDVPPTRMGNYKLSATSPSGASGVIDNGVRCVRVSATDVVASCTAQSGTTVVTLDGYDIDDDARPQGPAYDMGADEYLAATALNVAPRIARRRIDVSARVRPSKTIVASRALVGGQAPDQITSACTRCVARLEYRKGHGRIRVISMRRHGTTFRATTRTLRAGTYRIRVVITNRQTHRVHRSGWRTLHISTHRKGTR
jgi:hypothetical protein